MEDWGGNVSPVFYQLPLELGHRVPQGLAPDPSGLSDYQGDLGLAGPHSGGRWQSRGLAVGHDFRKTLHSSPLLLSSSNKATTCLPFLPPSGQTGGMCQVATVGSQGDLDCAHLSPLQVSVADLEDPGPAAPKANKVPGYPEWHTLRSRALRCPGARAPRGGPPALSYGDCFWTGRRCLGWEDALFAPPEPAQSRISW